MVNREYTLKASFILKFLNFIEWPERIDSNNFDLNNNYTFCIIGENPFKNILDLAKEEGLMKRKINLKRKVLISELNQCRILFINSSEANRIGEIVSQVKKYPLLSISDTKGFGEKGVGINFVGVGNKIRFEINRLAIEASGLKISSELLNLAINLE